MSSVGWRWDGVGGPHVPYLALVTRAEAGPAGPSENVHASLVFLPNLSLFRTDGCAVPVGSAAGRPGSVLHRMGASWPVSPELWEGPRIRAHVSHTPLFLSCRLYEGW